MNLDYIRRPRLLLWVGALGVLSVVVPASGQEAPGDQVLRFGFNQKFAAQDNLRLTPKSVGTTYYSDTRLTLGASTENGPNKLNFLAAGVGRIVNDPVIGNDADFRDPRLDLDYTREGANARFRFLTRYYKPDLAFLDPLREGNVSDQDIFRSGGSRESLRAGAKLELGLESPIGLVFDVNSRKSNYVDTNDPLLFSNESHSAAIGAIFRLSEVTQARIDWFESRYRAADTLSTDRDRRRLTFGLDHQFSQIDTFSLDYGRSEIVETFDALPGVENVLTSPVFGARFTRELVNGSAGVNFRSNLTNQGRQNTLRFSRSMDLPNGSLSFSFGVAEGDTFEPRPIGSLRYETQGVRSTFSANVVRTASISDVLSRATENTRLNLGYTLALTEVSGLSVDFLYGDISVLGIDDSRAARERSSLYASYNHAITEDWDVVVGYEARYFAPDVGPSSTTGGLFFTLRRDFEAYR